MFDEPNMTIKSEAKCGDVFNIAPVRSLLFNRNEDVLRSNRAEHFKLYIGSIVCTTLQAKKRLTKWHKLCSRCVRIRK